MTEKEYIIVSDLHKCLAASRLLRDTLPECNPFISQKELAEVIRTIERWTDETYRAITPLEDTV